MKRQISYLFLLAICVFMMVGCTFSNVPPKYDLKLSYNGQPLIASFGGESLQAEIKLNSYRYQELNSEQNIFLSYHILSQLGEMIQPDGIRTKLETVEARGVKKETLDIIAPLEKGEYIIEIDLVEEGVTWFSQQGMATLQIPMHVERTYSPDFSDMFLETDIENLKFSPENILTVPVKISNNSKTPLYAKGQAATFISYHIYDKSGHLILFDGKRTSLSKDIAPGKSEEINLIVDNTVFDPMTNYTLSVDLVIENVSWFSEKGMDTLDINLVSPSNTLRTN